MDDLVKNRKRAVRRKRNHIAKELRENKAYRHRVVATAKEKKRTRKNIRVQEIEQWLEEEKLVT